MNEKERDRMFEEIIEGMHDATAAVKRLNEENLKLRGIVPMMEKRLAEMRAAEEDPDRGTEWMIRGNELSYLLDLIRATL